MRAGGARRGGGVGGTTVSSNVVVAIIQHTLCLSVVCVRMPLASVKLLAVKQEISRLELPGVQLSKRVKIETASICQCRPNKCMNYNSIRLYSVCSISSYPRYAHCDNKTRKYKSITSC